MDGPALSGWERRLLEEIESDLRQDTKLDRKLSTMGAKRPGRLRRVLRAVGRRVTAGVVLTALVMTAICLGVGVRTPNTAVLVALGVVWAATVSAAVATSELLRRRSASRSGRAVVAEPEEHPERRERRPWDRPEA
ncbi:hypothetical protein ATKI12_6727 [Kitasatospora sp. Ki12]|uniref:DUF3040 domain-containing protein n=1 Tax=Kitasatospora xanthocidica TaxID=83382 RepID=UPI00167317AA|nr:DUF3040 domain-containing protein [Kitasatospora xanthocidica]GHF73136.1 hypothetical protein GCM10018790_58800 [Kitasatospora xanthocidica]